MITTIVKKVFGTKNDRVIKSLSPLIRKVHDHAESLSSISDQELKAFTNQFRERLDNGESLDSIQAEAFAVVREAATRVLGMTHFDVQLIGGAVLHDGMISEMKTGEGKTLMATLPAYLNAISGKGVHVVTVNDYLARRDAEWMGKVYNFLGLTVGCVYSGMDESTRKSAYQADVTYGQNNEFGFDFLRDNMKFTSEDMVQRGHNFAIVDEVDSILIDEARTPLIISGPADDSTERYLQINTIIPHLVAETHYEIDLKSKQPTLTEAGVSEVENLLKVENLYDPHNIEIVHHVNQALRAHKTMERDSDYVVRDGKIIIVDEFTGRLMDGRRWSKGLHQAVEAKEGVKINRESQTLASITFQNYFRMYEKLSGMTGTADTEAVEFSKIYELEVVVIPTNKPLLRKDLSDLIYRTKDEKYKGVVEEIKKVNEKGQPILVGTVTIDQSEIISKYLQKAGIQHDVLNAKQHEREADIVAQAGRLGAVTISTNMAGRGTDIVLGGNPEFLAAKEVNSRDWDDPENKKILEKYEKQCADEKKQVLAAGGLFILGTERHESRRIDNQLRGRAGRQGDPGTTRFFVSLEDDLMIRFGGEKLKQIMSMSIVGWEDGMAIDSPMISRKIEDAQKKVEGMHFESRKYVTEYDDVMNKQRQVIYNERAKILKGSGLCEEVPAMIDDVIEDLVLSVCQEQKKPIDWDIDKLKSAYEFIFNNSLDLGEQIELTEQGLFDRLRIQGKEVYDKKQKKNSEKLQSLKATAEQHTDSDDDDWAIIKEEIQDYETIVQRTMLEVLDNVWNLHLRDMDDLREGIGLRAYGQKNPLYEYQREAFGLFQDALGAYRETVLRRLCYLEIIDSDQLVAQIRAEQERRKHIEEQLKQLDKQRERAEGLHGSENRKDRLKKNRQFRKKKK